jgi:hypothetical protein
MLEWAGSKPTELRFRMPEAGGLVIAPSIEMANYMVRLIEPGTRTADPMAAASLRHGVTCPPGTTGAADAAPPLAARA